MEQVGDFVRVGPVNYNVVVTDMQEGLLGSINLSNSQITLKRGQSDDSAMVTLFHEVIHAILAQAGFQDHKEDEIKALSYGFVDFLKNNPHIFYESRDVTR